MATEQEPSRYSTAKTFLHVQGVLSIIFGGLGIVVGFPLVLLYVFSLPEFSSRYAYDGSDWIAVSVIIALGFIFWILPHVFMIIAGSYFVRKPKPNLAMGLTVANLVIGACLNYILLAFAIVSLAQTSSYREGYVESRKSTAKK